MPINHPAPTAFDRVLINALAIFALCASFGIYVYTEKKIDSANTHRQQSWVLANALRNSSDDLTRLCRYFAESGNPRYREYYQDVLDIRDGRMQKPEGYYAGVFWDRVIAGKIPAPTGHAPGISLLDEMRDAGFTELEFAKLAEAKEESDRLTMTEQEAVLLVAQYGLADPASHKKAVQLLYGDQYQKDKARIMEGVSQFLAMVDARTQKEVNDWVNIAYTFRVITIALALAVLVLLCSTYRALQRILGERAESILARMWEIGQGNWHTPIPLTDSNRDSILGGLAKMREELQSLDEKRREAEDKLTRSLAETRAILDTLVEPIVTIDCKGRIGSFNPAAEKLFGYAAQEIIGQNVSVLMPEPYRTEHDKYISSYLEHGVAKIIGIGRDVEGQKRDGTIFPMHLSVGETTPGGCRTFVGAIYDLTLRKRMEEDLRIAAATFDSHEAIMITDADSNIIRVNKAFEALTGYSAQEVIGKNPRILKSDKQNNAFYDAMWHEILILGKWAGEIWDRRKDGSIYPKFATITAIRNAEGKTTQYISIFSDISERKQAEEAIHNLAFFDALTGLPNRRYLLDRLEMAVAAAQRGYRFSALLFLDLDKFKSLNDTMGHDYGDLLLTEVGSRIKLCVRQHIDTVARIGGDEFVVLLENLGSNENSATAKAAQVAEKIRSVLSTPYQLKDHIYHTSPSIGVCIFAGAEKTDELIKRADMAMYQAKESGRNQVQFFDPKLQQSVEDRVMLETDLRRAVFNNEFELHYQLQVDNRQVPCGAEALIRWRHPTRGMVPPARFIPIAEESALILDIGDWVLNEACRQIAEWSRDGKSSGLPVAINVSSRQFAQPGFIGMVRAAIEKHGIAPTMLKLELTESVALNDLESVISRMLALKTIVGVKLSLDDFGTGYSSLSYLKQLPIDQIKIDQSFVRGIVVDRNDAIMVKTIVDLAHNFALEAVAEGVETESHFDLLKQYGTVSYQGYYFSRPLPAAEFEAFLARQYGKAP